mmetsp:Transcript_36790/g.115747  ORF Transcript_36790/g.115747 Transcript_36790/m.115747 type:complete len:270 (+) Transcript_36790:213-1022(+)
MNMPSPLRMLIPGASAPPASRRSVGVNGEEGSVATGEAASETIPLTKLSPTEDELRAEGGASLASHIPPAGPPDLPGTAASCGPRPPLEDAVCLSRGLLPPLGDPLRTASAQPLDADAVSSVTLPPEVPRAAAATRPRESATEAPQASLWQATSASAGSSISPGAPAPLRCLGKLGAVSRASPQAALAAAPGPSAAAALIFDAQPWIASAASPQTPAHLCKAALTSVPPAPLACAKSALNASVPWSFLRRAKSTWSARMASSSTAAVCA